MKSNDKQRLSGFIVSQKVPYHQSISNFYGVLRYWRQKQLHLPAYIKTFTAEKISIQPLLSKNPCFCLRQPTSTPSQSSKSLFTKRNRGTSPTREPTDNGGKNSGKRGCWKVRRSVEKKLKGISHPTKSRSTTGVISKVRNHYWCATFRLNRWKPASALHSLMERAPKTKSWNSVENGVEFRRTQAGDTRKNARCLKSGWVCPRQKNKRTLMRLALCWKAGGWMLPIS